MKKFLAIKFILIFLFLNEEVFSSTFGVVNSIRYGDVFLVNKGKNSKNLKEGDFLEENSQILAEKGAIIVFSDYEDHQFILSSSGMATFKANSLELLRGSLRIRTLNYRDKNTLIYTPNSILSFSEAEGILSFDPEKHKSELVSIDGVFEFKGKKEPRSSVNVAEGFKSIIKNDVQIGMPSLPQRFDNQDLDRFAEVFLNGDLGRKMASISSGKIIFIPKEKHKSLKSQKRRLPSSRIKPQMVPILIFRAKDGEGPLSTTPLPSKSELKKMDLLEELKAFKRSKSL